MMGESRKNKSSQLNMSWLAFDSILPYLDVHKRLSISICSPWFRKLEKQTYIYFDEIEIEPFNIKIDDKDYKVGEILDIEKTSEVDNHNVRSIKKSIRNANFQGGSDWISMEDDLPEPGDIFLYQDCTERLEQQKIEKMNKLRHSFMGELEKYSNSEITVNPLDVFEQSFTECKDEWSIELTRMFDTMNKSSPFNIQGIFEKHPLLEYEDHIPLQQDDLSDMYPNAFNLMKSKIEEMNRKSDIRASALEMLAYKPVTVPHFNQFTVFDVSPEYSNRIPDGFSIRHALKHFLLVILTERKNIRIGKFNLEGYGIFPLPVGLKFDCEQFDFSLFSEDGSGTKIYETLVRSVNRINLECYSRLQYREAFNCEMVRNCKTLYIPSHGTDHVGSEFKFVNNEVVFFEIRCFIYAELLIDVIRSWTSNTDRRIGSKLFITYREMIFPPNTDVEIWLGELRRMGFRMKEDSNQSMFLLLAANKRVELTLLKNNLSLPREFLQGNRSDHYCSLEVVGSK